MTGLKKWKRLLANRWHIISMQYDNGHNTRHTMSPFCCQVLSSCAALSVCNDVAFGLIIFSYNVSEFVTL
jgi:hypothetical protein